MDIERIGYALIGAAAVIWIVAMIGGLIAAFPFGLVGLVAIVGVGLLFLKVLNDRLNNQEDRYYSDNVDK